MIVGRRRKRKRKVMLLLGGVAKRKSEARVGLIEEAKGNRRERKMEGR
jgi:hypothetical protein